MIEVRNLTKRFGPALAVDNVSFTVAANSVTGFVGPNGAGKSTVLRMIAGLAAPDSGNVLVGGASPLQARRSSPRLGVFLSAEWLPARMSAPDYLRYVADCHRLRHDGVDEALDLAGLESAGRKRIEKFSLGMKQRLGIAAVVMMQPSVIVLDEPVNGLDPDGVQWFRRFCGSAVTRGASMLLSSHQMNDLALIADHIVMIDQGRVISDGSVEDFTADSARRVYVESDDIERVDVLMTRRGWRTERRGNGLIVAGARPSAIGEEAFAREGPGVSHLSQITMSVEESYFERLEDGRT